MEDLRKGVLSVIDGTEDEYVMARREEEEFKTRAAERLAGRKVQERCNN